MKIFLVALVALTANSLAASACSCAPPPAPKIALQQAGAVFSGTVTSVKREALTLHAQFEVAQKWKGVEGKTVTVVTSESSASCGVNFESGKKYLVYALKNADDAAGAPLRTNLCTRTTSWENAAADIAELGVPDEAPQSAPATEVQINQIPPLALQTLAQSLADNPRSPRFRINWNTTFGAEWSGTALYNRANSTVKIYTKSQTPTSKRVTVKSVIYHGVTDSILKELAKKYGSDETLFTGSMIFDKLPEFGAVKARALVPR